MLNYNTLLSSYDDKLTLMQWLKKVEAALKDASAVSFNVNKRGNATITFSVVFEDGSELETGPIILQQGESVTNAAITNGHLILTLSNGDTLDAGNTGAVSGFSINGSQHLIVTYQDGTTQDLGAIFSGNVNIAGTLAVTGKISGGEIVEDMSGYSFSGAVSAAPFTFDFVYAGVVKNGNKLTLVCAIDAVRSGEVQTYGEYAVLGDFTIPQSVNEKIIPFRTGTAFGEIVTKNQILAVTDPQSSGVEIEGFTQQLYNPQGIRFYLRGLNALSLNTHYYIRAEITLLLSENLAE